MNTNEIFINISKLPKPLEQDELHELLIKANQGDKKAREKIVTHNIRLVISIVINKFKFIEYDQKELVAIGNLGLIKAVNSFDVTRNIKFATYASKCIDNEIKMFLRKLRKEEVVDSFNKILFNDFKGNELTIEETLKDDKNITEDYIKEETHLFIRELVNNLSYKDRQIIIMYFGFFDNKIYTQKEIAEKLNISQSYISRIIKRILKQLKIELITNNIVELGNNNIKIKNKKKI